jgi:hypothetical protein
MFIKATGTAMRCKLLIAENIAAKNAKAAATAEQNN